MTQVHKFLFIILLWCFMPLMASSQVLENYNSLLRIYHKSDFFYSPERLEVDINVKEFPLSEFKIIVPADAAVFLDNVLWFFAESDTTVRVESLSLDESSSSFRRLSFLKDNIEKAEVSVLKGYFTGEVIREIPLVKEDSILSRRDREVIKEFFYIALIIILFFIALFKIIYPLLFSLLINPISMFSAEDFSDNMSRPRIFSSDVVYYLVVFSMLFMLFLVTAIYYMDILALRDFLKNELNFMFLIWLVGTIGLFLITILKLFWLKISTGIYRIVKLEYIHFFYMLRIISFSLLLIFLILIIVLSNDLMNPGNLFSYLLGLFFVLYIFGISMLFFLMTKKVSYKNYHLFSYLCTAELVPFLVLAKLIIG